MCRERVRTGRAGPQGQPGKAGDRARRVTSAAVDPFPCVQRQQVSRPGYTRNVSPEVQVLCRQSGLGKHAVSSTSGSKPGHTLQVSGPGHTVRQCEARLGPLTSCHVDEWTEILHSDLRWAVTRTHTHAHALAAPAPPPPGSRPWSLPPPCRSPRQPVLSGPRACCLHSQLHPARERRGAAAGFTSCACACSPWGDAQPWSTLHKHLPSDRSQEPTAVHSPQLPAAPPGPARRLRLSSAEALTSRGPGTHSAADEDSV